MAPWEWAHVILERVTKAGELWLAAFEPSLLASHVAGLKGNEEIVAPEAQLRRTEVWLPRAVVTSYCNSSSKRRGSGAGNVSRNIPVFLTKAEGDFPGQGANGASWEFTHI